MGTRFYIELLPRKEGAQLTRDRLAGLLDLLHRWSKEAKSQSEVAVSEPGGVNQTQAWPATLGDAAEKVRALDWPRVGSYKLIQKDASAMERIFGAGKGKEAPFRVSAMRLSWNPGTPRHLDPTAEDCRGYLPSCRSCSTPRAISLAHALHVTRQQDRWKCPNCGMVVGVNWIEDAETLAFTRPFSLGFVGPEGYEDPNLPCIRRKSFAEELEQGLGFSVREWFSWIRE